MRPPCHVADIDGEGLQFTAVSGGSDSQEKGQLMETYNSEAPLRGSKGDQPGDRESPRGSRMELVT